MPTRLLTKPKPVSKAAASSQTAHEKFADDSAVDLGTSNGIVIKGMTIPYGSSNLLINAEVKFTAGSIYGIVARNGLGKSALLHRLDVVKIGVPKLLVKQEQELENQELSPFEAVKSSHTELVALEKRLAETTDDDEYNYIQNRLDELGLDKQESTINVILHGLGFTEEHLNKSVRQLSGGWRKRVVIAAAIYRKPDFLMLDEPTNHLDLEAVLWLEHYLLTHYNSPNSRNVSTSTSKKVRTLIVVSHNAEFMQTLCQTMVTIEKAKLYYYPKTSYEEFLQIHRTRMTAPLVTTDKSKLKVLYDKFMNEPAKCLPKDYRSAGVNENDFRITFDILEAHGSGEYNDAKHKEFVKVYNNNTPKPVEFPLLDPRFPTGLDNSREILDVIDFSFSYPGSKPLFNINLTVKLGDVICICWYERNR